MSTEKQFLGRVLAEDLHAKDTTLVQQIEQNRVYCEHKIVGEPRYGRLSLKNDMVCIHHMDMGHIPHDSYVVNYADALELIDESSRLTFLELGGSGRTLGQLIIRLSPNTKGAHQFFLLCSGERGISYANTRLFQVNHRGKKWEYVGGGDYEYNNGDGGRAMVSGLELGPQYERPWVAGTVRGFWGLGTSVSAQFFINTRDHPPGVCSPAFGIVENGLDVLKNAINSYPDISEVSVQDCGIILDS